MKTHQMISVLLASMFFGAGLANAQLASNDLVNGVKLRGNGSVDDTQPGVASGPVVAGVKLRGNGSVDDTQPGAVNGTVASGVKLRGDGTVDDTQPGSMDHAASHDTLAAKQANIERQRAKREVQRERALAGLATNDPKRIEINAHFDRQLAKLDAKAERLELRGSDDNSVRAGDDNGVRREDRREDRRADRRDERREDHAQRAEKTERPEKAERAERVERTERTERVERAERVERNGRA